MGVADHVVVGVRVGDGVHVACVGVMVGVLVGGAVMGAGVRVFVGVAVVVEVEVLVVTVGTLWLRHSTAPTVNTVRVAPKKSTGELISPA